jgi:serine/threonine-protein kinase
MGRETLQLRLNKGDAIDGKYLVIKKLGEGGCGSVFRCRHVKKTDHEVAVKVLENAADEPRFRREQRVLGGVRSQYVIKLLDYGKHDRHPYLVLEFMEGGSVRDLLNACGKLSAEQAAWVVIQAVRGLRASRTVHRDLKPENLLISKGQNGRNVPLLIDDPRKGAAIKVADFGLAKNRDANQTNLTNTGQIMGTPLYMSPEQCRNTRDVTIASDIYSLGVILYELVVGKPPFDADNAYDIMAMHCNEEMPNQPRMDPRVRNVIARCCAKSAKDRYRSLLALERELAPIAGIGAPEPDPFRIGTFLLLLVVFLVIGALLWLVHEDLLRWVGDWWNGTGGHPAPSAPAGHAAPLHAPPPAAAPPR